VPRTQARRHLFSVNGGAMPDGDDDDRHDRLLNAANDSIIPNPLTAKPVFRPAKGFPERPSVAGCLNPSL
jgi:hypothetical protein